eukprot:1063723_1
MRSPMFEGLVLDLQLSAVKKSWMGVIEEIGFLEPERHRFHGIRKGWATRLRRCGIALSIVAYGGRWKLLGAIYAYVLHGQAELLPLAGVYRDGNELSRCGSGQDRV